MPEVMVAQPEMNAVLRGCAAFPGPLTWRLMDAPLREAYLTLGLYAMMALGAAVEVRAFMKNGREQVSYVFGSGRES